ncbi:MAG: uroporphyrinogen decarboxylase family protein [Verrucomicrobiota bacterium]|nr:uroporphyrinogen decarboxylase family protein [Verrucomicrobiota bacterium]
MENFHRMLEGRKPEWMPFEVPATPPVCELIKRKMHGQWPDEAFDTDFKNLWCGYKDQDAALWRSATEALGFVYPPHSEIGGLGSAWVRPPVETLGEATHLTEMLHPLSTVTEVKQLESLPWANTADPSHYTDMESIYKSFHERGKVAVGCLECTIFESAWYARGMENIFYDLAEENGIADWLFDYFTERSINTARAYVKAGADLIRLGDDVGMQSQLIMSQSTWRTQLKPRLKRVIDAIRDASTRKVWVQYHSDGNVTALMDDLIEIGVDILNPVQPECMDVIALAAKYQHQIAFSGMIGTQTTMPFGSTDAVRAAVQQCAELHRKGARVIVAPTHVLEPDVPWENIVAFVESVKGMRFW